MSPQSPVCCLVTASHLAQLHVFAKALTRWHAGPCHCLLIDSDDLALLPEGISGIRLLDIIDEDSWKIRQGRFAPFEAIMSLKPRLIRHVLEKTGQDCIYLDTDVLVLQPFAERLAMEEGASILLTPHLNGPLDTARQREEMAFLLAGVFNAGVIGVATADAARAFLEWWDTRCHEYCLNRQAQGLFVDQRWLDLAPTLFRNVATCTDPGINLGHWRIGEEGDVSADEAGRLLYAGTTVALLHLSGFDPLFPDDLSRHSTRRLKPASAFGRLLREYGQQLLIERQAASKGKRSGALAPLPPSALSASDIVVGVSESGGHLSTKDLWPPPTIRPAAASTKAFPTSFGVNIFGQFTSATGLGVTARHTARALRVAGVPFACFDITAYYPTGDVAAELADISAHITNNPSDLRFPINLYCMPAIDFPRIVQRIPHLLQQPRFHAAVVWWETTKLHASWAHALIELDAVVAYSEFLAGVLTNSLPLTPVITGRQPLFLPDGIRHDRAAFGLPVEATVFVSSFDPSSDPVRKNPLGVIAAFRQAFPNQEAGVRLVLRLNNADATDMARQATRLLIDAAGEDGRVGFLLEPMEYRQVLALYASADVYVSLHRAEGLGLGLLEAMRLGIPVIATAWSGNMTFMDHRCAKLVRYRLIQVSGNHPFYRTAVLGPEAVWADPVIEDAVAWMRHLHSNPEERRRVGELGRLRTERYQEDAMDLDWLHELAEIWRSATLLPQVNEKLSSAAKMQ